MLSNQSFIFLDNYSTTPLDPRVFEEMKPFLLSMYANPSSLHYFGSLVGRSVKKARQRVASLIGSDADEVIFTSGATEAINHALIGTASHLKSKGNHIISVRTEHPAALNTCRFLEGNGFDISLLNVDKSGLIRFDELEHLLRRDTILVSVMHVNHETGVIQPIKQISELAHKYGAFFMSDCTQSVGKIPTDVNNLGVDIMTFSGHKLYGPKGIGALYVRKENSEAKILPLIHGGGQESGLRSGTLNVPGIVALGKACELAEQEMIYESKRLIKYRSTLEVELLKYPGSFINGLLPQRLFNVSNICFPKLYAPVLIAKMKQVAIANGSACSSATMTPSNVLTSMGLSNEQAFSSIRFSFGRFNNENETNSVVEMFWDTCNSMNLLC